MNLNCSVSSGPLFVGKVKYGIGHGIVQRIVSSFVPKAWEFVNISGNEASLTGATGDKVVGKFVQHGRHGIRGIHGECVTRQVDKDIPLAIKFLDGHFHAPKAVVVLVRFAVRLVGVVPWHPRVSQSRCGGLEWHEIDEQHPAYLLHYEQSSNKKYGHRHLYCCLGHSSGARREGDIPVDTPRPLRRRHLKR
eukprot:scaffold1690_cov182-Amphora_coffeaeformis.AAC.51